MTPEPRADGELLCAFCDGGDDVRVIDVLYEEEDGSDGLQDIQPVCRPCRTDD